MTTPSKPGRFQRLRDIAKAARREVKVYRLVLRDRRTPLMGKVLLATAVGYLLLPFDLIPDFIPVLGQLDDLVIVPLLVIGALKLIPREVVEDCRARVARQYAEKERRGDS